MRFVNVKLYNALQLSATVAMLVGCSNNHEAARKYPGSLPRYHTCHDLFDHGYDFNVAKCEHDLENPKFKRGQEVRILKGYDKSCRATIIGAWRWSWKPDEAVYSAKVYCNGKPQHDKFCEEGNTLNCPDFRESELK